MRTYVLVATIALSGFACTRSLKQVYGPEGELLYEANCTGRRRTMGDCMNVAGKTCGPTGYEIIERDKEAGDTYTSAWGSRNYASAYTSNETRRTMLFRCKSDKTVKAPVMPKSAEPPAEAKTGDPAADMRTRVSTDPKS